MVKGWQQPSRTCRFHEVLCTFRGVTGGGRDIGSPLSLHLRLPSFCRDALPHSSRGQRPNSASCSTLESLGMAGWPSEGYPRRKQSRGGGAVALLEDVRGGARSA
jgi:hypothetical protein